MKLQKEPFEKITQGTKTVELRLNDEKRKELEIGDKITFSLIDNPHTTLKTKVTGLFPYKSFEELFKYFPPGATGSKTRDDWRLMRQYYSEEDEKNTESLELKLNYLIRFFCQENSNVVPHGAPVNLSPLYGIYCLYRNQKTCYFRTFGYGTDIRNLEETVMASKCDWEVEFIDGTIVTVKAAGTRMAKATACVRARKSPDEIASWNKMGRTRNGAKPRNPNRPQPYHKGHQGRRRSSWW